uniref:hypothetical protein n=1 Tax=Stappia sp. TaxID=1870903 RepID=UPI003BADAF3A
MTDLLPCPFGDADKMALAMVGVVFCMARDDAGLSIAEAASLSGVAPGDLIDAERGKDVPALSLLRLCRLYEVDPFEWVGLAPKLRECGLTPQEARVFTVLLCRGAATRVAMLTGLYRDSGRRGGGIVKVIVCNLRKKLKRLGIEIHTRRGEGWCLDEAQRESLWQMLWRPQA